MGDNLNGPPAGPDDFVINWDHAANLQDEAGGFIHGPDAQRQPHWSINGTESAQDDLPQGTLAQLDRRMAATGLWRDEMDGVGPTRAIFNNAHGNPSLHSTFDANYLHQGIYPGTDRLTYFHHRANFPGPGPESVERFYSFPQVDEWENEDRQFEARERAEMASEDLNAERTFNAVERRSRVHPIERAFFDSVSRGEMPDPALARRFRAIQRGRRRPRRSLSEDRDGVA